MSNEAEKLPADYRAAIAVLIAAIAVTGCARREPYNNCTEGFAGVRVIDAKAKRECSDAGKCWLSADDYAEIKRTEMFYPNCFGMVEQ